MCWDAVYWDAVYWDEALVDDPADRSCLAGLSDPDTGPETWLRCLEKLLNSRSVVAQGVAIDRYSVDQMSGRWGPEPVSTPLTGTVARVIREHLTAPPWWRDCDGVGRVAVNHACALAALRWVVTPGDADLIATVADQARDPLTKANVVLAAKECSRAHLDGGPDAERATRTLRRVLTALADDDALEPHERADAVLLLRADDGSHVVDLLRRLLDRDERNVSAAAAIALMRTRFAEHQTRIARRLDDWESGPGIARRARELYFLAVAETDDLGASPQRLAAVRELRADSEARDLLLRLLERPEQDLSAAAAIALMRTSFSAYRTSIAQRLPDWDGDSPLTTNARETYHLNVVDPGNQLDVALRVESTLRLSADSGREVASVLLQLLHRREVDVSAAAAIALMRTHFAAYHTHIAKRMRRKWDDDSPIARAARETYQARLADRYG